MGGLDSQELYSYTHYGTKALVDEYASEMIQALEFVARTKKISINEKREFFEKVSRLYGQSAICLSGGATLSYYHIGVIKALFEHHLLPNVFTGASAGSLIVSRFSKKY